jgi:hypothetical protein
LPRQGFEVGVALVEPALHRDLEAVPRIAEQIDRHADREVAEHRRVEGDEDLPKAEYDGGSWLAKAKELS